MMIIPDYILQTTRMSESELKQEIAVMLFEKKKLTLTEASDFAEMNRYQFKQLLDSRLIPVHYDPKDFEENFQKLREMEKNEGSGLQFFKLKIKFVVIALAIHIDKSLKRLLQTDAPNIKIIT